MQNNLLAVKKEEATEGSAPSRLRTTKGKGKEPLRQLAGEEASDMPEDESMEDNEHLFGKFESLTAPPRGILALTRPTVEN